MEKVTLNHLAYVHSKLMTQMTQPSRGVVMLLNPPEENHMFREKGTFKRNRIIFQPLIFRGYGSFQGTIEGVPV